MEKLGVETVSHDYLAELERQLYGALSAKVEQGEYGDARKIIGLLEECGLI